MIRRILGGIVMFFIVLVFIVIFLIKTLTEPSTPPKFIDHQPPSATASPSAIVSPSAIASPPTTP